MTLSQWVVTLTLKWQETQHFFEKLKIVKNNTVKRQALSFIECAFLLYYSLFFL